MPGNVTGPFMCGCTQPDYKYCPTCLLSEGKPLISTCLVYPDPYGKPKEIDEAAVANGI